MHPQKAVGKRSVDSISVDGLIAHRRDIGFETDSASGTFLPRRFFEFLFANHIMFL
jgi:hypothetical protein